LSCFSVGIAPVAFCFLRSLIVNVARIKVLLDLVACCRLDVGRSVGFHLTLVCTLFIFAHYPCALRLPFFPGRSNSKTLFLTCQPVRFCGLLGDAVGVKASSLGRSSGATAISEVIVFLVSHICIPFDVSLFWSPNPFRAGRNYRAG